MPTGRAVLLLRRLSTGDNRFKGLNLNQNTKEPLVANPVCSHTPRDFGLPKRLSSFGSSNIAVSQLTRSFSDNKIVMAAPSPESPSTESSSSESPSYESPSSESPTGFPTTGKPKYTNRLIFEKSPYLLQHAHNPVQWYPWCQDAIDKAKKEHKIIFLSVGYSTCHWCHVMERETFQNEEIAEILNEHYVSIKVDREERPDIDRVYLLFVMATIGNGGWPMSVFLTPELRPFTGGTFFPPEDRYGMPGFKALLLSLAQKWKDNDRHILLSSCSIMGSLQKVALLDGDSSDSVPGQKTCYRCYETYMANYEEEYGGFGTAPKFPQASIFNFLFHYYARDKSDHRGQTCLDMALHTLTKIANGGIHDHISGGFARYSVDNDWHIPHFEKMLYDQAQLTVAYTDAYVASKDEFYADVVRDIIKYVNRDLRHESGGYYSAEDADSYRQLGDSYKREGAFYTWNFHDLESLLSDKKINSVSYLDIFCNYFNVEENGNIPHESDPHYQMTSENVLIIYGTKEETANKFNLSLEQFNQVLSECIEILHEARQKRPRPDLDTKMLCSWNGLMIAGLAKAGQGLGEKAYVEDAIKTAEFIQEHLYDKSTKKLIHSVYRSEDGSLSQYDKPINGFLDDYAFLIKGLLDLYEASLDYRWLKWARELQQIQNELFWDTEDACYFTCSAGDPTVLLRLKQDQDGAEPSGNSVSCHNLLRLAAYGDKSAAPEGGDCERGMTRKVLKAFANRLTSQPTSLPEMMSALMLYHDSPTQVLIAGGCSDPRTLELVRAVRSRLLPGRVLAVADPAHDSPAGMSDILLNRVRTVGDVPTAYVCRRFACSLPVTDVKQLETLLDEDPAPTSQRK